MSFSAEVKEEILKIEPKSQAEVKYEISAILEFSKKEKLNKFSQKRINFLNNFIKNLPEIKMFDEASISLRGAFLACGNLTNPEIDYHLEFNLSDFINAEKLLNLFKKIENLGIFPNSTRRKKHPVIYLKGVEKIINFLALMGAKICAMDFIQKRMISEVREHVNRTTNFETANLSKIANSSASQIEAIKKIKKNKKFDLLPESLKEIVEIRLSHPFATLSEIASLCKNNLTKSGANSRLKKIEKLASN